MLAAVCSTLTQDAVGEAPGGAEDHASLMCGESTESFRGTQTPAEISFAQWIHSSHSNTRQHPWGREKSQE